MSTTMQAQTSRGAVLRGFLPSLPSYNPTIGGYDSLLPGAVELMPMCSAPEGVKVVTDQGLTLGRSDDYQVGVYPVEAGMELKTCRPDKADHCQRFDQAGVVVDVRLPVELAQLARRLASTSGMGLSVGFEHLAGYWKRCRIDGSNDFREVFQVSKARLETVKLTAGSDKDPGTKVWILE